MWCLDGEDARPQRDSFRMRPASAPQFAISGGTGLEGDIKGRTDLHLKNNELKSVVMDTVRAIASIFRRRSTSEIESSTSEVAHESHRSTTVEKLSVEQVKFRWRQEQIENHKKQLTHLNSSWRRKQMFDGIRTKSNMRNNIQNFGYFDGNPSEMQRACIFGNELDANPSAKLPKWHSIGLTASSIWRKSQAS
jgi:hypothetical protein